MPKTFDGEMREVLRRYIGFSYYKSEDEAITALKALFSKAIGDDKTVPKPQNIRGHLSCSDMNHAMGYNLRGEEIRKACGI